jgi:hypothetical protein
MTQRVDALLFSAFLALAFYLADLIISHMTSGPLECDHLLTALCF